MPVEQLLAVAGFVTVAVATPGPNNVIVLSVAARAGFAAAVPAIMGVLAGSLALLVFVWVGAGLLFDAVAGLRPVMAATGALYLAWLGVVLIWRAGTAEAGAGGWRGGMPGTALGLAGFQFLNPKAWVLVLTATAASSGDPTGFAVLAAIFMVLPGLCLSLWAGAGSAIAGWLQASGPRRWFDRAMGALLIGCAGLLFV